jgi:hypothetical protein
LNLQHGRPYVFERFSFHRAAHAHGHSLAPDKVDELVILLRIKPGTAEEALEQVLEIENDADAITKHGREKQPILSRLTNRNIQLSVIIWSGKNQRANRDSDG